MVGSILVVNEGIKPVLVEYAQVRVSQVASKALGIAVSRKISEDLEAGDLIEVQVDENGKVENYIFNTVVENRVRRNVQYRVETFMKLLEKGEQPELGTPLEIEEELAPSERELLEAIRERGLLIEVPLGQALGVPVLANLGPKIPINLEAVGDVYTEVKSEMVETGINGALIRVNVYIQVNVRIIMPFASNPVVLEQNIPVTRMFHPGEVPEYYQGGEGDSNLSIPLDPLN